MGISDTLSWQEPTQQPPPPQAMRTSPHCHHPGLSSSEQPQSPPPCSWTPGRSSNRSPATTKATIFNPETNHTNHQSIRPPNHLRRSSAEQRRLEATVQPSPPLGLHHPQHLHDGAPRRGRRPAVLVGAGAGDPPLGHPLRLLPGIDLQRFEHHPQPIKNGGADQVIERERVERQTVWRGYVMIWATMPAPAPARPLTTAFDMAGGRGARFQSVRRLWLAGWGWAFSTTMAAALEEVGFDQRALLAEKTGWKLGGDWLEMRLVFVPRHYYPPIHPLYKTFWLHLIIWYFLLHCSKFRRITSFFYFFIYHKVKFIYTTFFFC